MFFEQAEGDLLEEDGDGLFFGDHGGGRFDLDGAKGFDKGDAGIRGLSDTHLEEDGTEGEHLGSRTAFVGRHLFGGEVGGMSFEQAIFGFVARAEDLGDPKVEQAGGTVFVDADMFGGKVSV